MDQQTCPACGIVLSEPYIKCVVCSDLSLCLQCFAKGYEYLDHKNDHSYLIMRNNFFLFGSSWTASEEVQLLEAITKYGYGNWADVAKIVGTKSKVECEKHYLKYYVNDPILPLQVMKQRDIVVNNHPTPIAYSASQDPPRPAIGSVLYNEMAGYMPGRGDFATEYDDYAELDIKDIDFVEEKDELMLEVQKAVVNIYRHRLRERARRKCTIRTYGLISAQKNVEEWRRYNMLGRPVLEKMKNLMRILKPLHFDKFMEGILYEAKLKSRIHLLQESREAGITKQCNIEMYLKLKKKAEERKRNKSLLDNILVYMKDDFSRQQYFRKQVLSENSQGLPDVISSSTGRRTAPPLNISGLPGYAKLSEKERELCSTLRLYPTAYLQHKDTLLHEYRKLGSLRLANARAVIKIDVNKTRKIYDLLVEDGLVSK